MSRIEKARASVPWSDISDLLELYEVSAGHRDALIQLARESRQQAWWQSYSDVLSSFRNLATYIDFESAAVSLRMYTPLAVPGLLQTEDYARAVIGTTGPVERTEAEIERRVELRMQRQAAIAKEPPLELWVILDEAALHRVVGGPQVMREQVEHLIEVARRPEVTLQVIPFGAGAHVAMAGEFSIFSFPEGPDVVHVEAVTGTLYLDRMSDLARASVCFDHLRTKALTAIGTVELLADVVRRYE